MDFSKKNNKKKANNNHTHLLNNKVAKEINRMDNLMLSLLYIRYIKKMASLQTPKLKNLCPVLLSNQTPPKIRLLNNKLIRIK